MLAKKSDSFSWAVSIGLHAFFLGVVALLVFSRKIMNQTETIPFDVIVAPTEVKGTPNLKALSKPLVPAASRPKIEVKSRAVFGLSKKAVSDESSNVSVKAGNTVAKAEDKLTLRLGDAVSLPIPADEYMVSQMPRISREIRAPYPSEAKSKRIQGAVLMELLIDESGKVRQIKVLQGPGFGLNEAAANAAAQFLFEPAKVGDRAVAVLIRYNYKFVLE